jgi:CheY-like chemotaxis protein
VPRILVADDNTNIQRMVALAFQDRGIEVTAVGNGEAAVRRMPDLNPDLVLADIFMPVRNGYELCEWVKKDSRFSHIPVILLVGAFDPLDEKEARRVGADGVLKKPFIPPDPLIAMVTSALEKNSKIAAELHAPKEAVAAAPPPPAPTAFEMPAKIELKPVPEFPEPSPDEAALVYAFGTGRRALDDADNAEEAAAPKAAEDEVVEEFDGASTTNDWRRTAMDFEVPEEAAGRPAFSSVEDLESTFPSERDVPPRHLHASEPEDEIEPVSQQSVTEETETSSHWAQLAKARPADEIVTTTDNDIQNAEAEVVAGSVAAENEVRTEAASTAETVIPAAQEPEPEMSEACGAKAEAVLEPTRSFASKPSHWMDLMASSSDPSPSDWFASTQPSAKVKALEVSDSPAPSVALSSEAVPALEAITPTEPKIAETIAATLPESEDEPFFADEFEPGISDEVAAAETENETVVTAEVLAEVSDETLTEAADEPPVNEVEQVRAEHAAESSALPEAASELVAEPSDEPPSYKESDLVEAPAVHVTPEPLLVEEPVHESSGYGARQEHIPPAHSFLLPPQEIRGTEEPLTEGSVAEAPVDEEPAPRDFSEHHEIETSALEFSLAEFHSRVPTVPPPSRDALDEIPFLNPPLAFSEHEESRSVVNRGAIDTVTVDAVVERLLQKIQPQLRELLSQDALKPLIETLLQDEREKSER